MVDIVRFEKQMDGISKGGAAEMTLGDQTGTYDCALPQPWVDSMAERGLDVRSHFVWYYPNGGTGMIPGYPHPITREGVEMLGIVARSA